MYCSIGCKVIFRISQHNRYYSQDTKIYHFSYRLFPVDTQNHFSKIKKNQSWARWAQIGPCSPTPVEVDVVGRCCRISSGRHMGLLGPPSSSGSALTAAQLEQWGLLGDGSNGSALTASSSGSSGASSPRLPCTPCRRRAPPPSRLRPKPPLPPLETRAAAYSDMAFQIWTSSVSSRSAPPSACHGTRHLTQWTSMKMSGGRERGWRPEQRGAYLNMMMLPMKVAQRAAPEQMAKEMRWASLAEMR
jgi:hypothetical protein